MIDNSDFFVNIKRIMIAHEYTLDHVRKCAYPVGRKSYGIVYVLSGEAEYVFVDEERVRLTKGNFIFISPSAAYSIITDGEFNHYTVNFEIYPDNSRLGELNGPYAVLKDGYKETLPQIFKRLISVWCEKRPGCEMLSVSALYELIYGFFSEYTARKSEKVSDRLLPAKAFIEKHFDKQPSLDELAYLSNMSVTNFRREWTKRYSMSPIKYRDTIRLYYAKEFLSTGYYSVCEVARKCGFEDVSYFVRFFKKNTGITPGDFKRGKA